MQMSRYFNGKNGKMKYPKKNNDKIDCNEIALNLIDGGGINLLQEERIRSDPNKIEDIILRN